MKKIYFFLFLFDIDFIGDKISAKQKVLTFHGCHVIQYIGLTGQNCSGKGVASEVLREAGYTYFSLSDIVREEALERGLDTGRENLIMVGTDLRRQEGPGTLAMRILDKLGEPSIIDSIRNPEEIEVLRSLDDFILIGITAPAELRFARMQERGRSGDAGTFEVFLEQEKREQSSSSSGQQLHKCLEMADKIVENSGSLEEFREKLLSTCEIE